MKIDIILDDNKHDDEIESVIIEAFKQTSEARLVRNIKKHAKYYLSYLAFIDNKLVGHLMISPMLLNGLEEILCLAPISILEEYQNLGIGGMLIKKAIKDVVKNKEYKLLCVLGSDHYYQRFGFVSINPKKFNIPFDVETRYFQLLELEKGYLEKAKGNFDYPSYFGI